MRHLLEGFSLGLVPRASRGALVPSPAQASNQSISVYATSSSLGWIKPPLLSAPRTKDKRIETRRK